MLDASTNLENHFNERHSPTPRGVREKMTLSLQRGVRGKVLFFHSVKNDEQEIWEKVFKV